MKMPSLALVVSLLVPVGPAFAQGGAVTFPMAVKSSEDVHYTCKDNKAITVSYVNATNGDAFAYVPVDGAPHVFVGVTSGSGVRYANGRYIWWNKGNTGRLIVDGDESAPPLLADCVAAKR
jgi:membrane-bound inhibitor of C-type lysozyme